MVMWLCHTLSACEFSDVTWYTVFMDRLATVKTAHWPPREGSFQVCILFIHSWSLVIRLFHTTAKFSWITNSKATSLYLVRGEDDRHSPSAVGSYMVMCSQTWCEVLTEYIQGSIFTSPVMVHHMVQGLAGKWTMLRIHYLKNCWTGFHKAVVNYIVGTCITFMSSSCIQP